MIPKWVICLCIGFAFWGILVGIMVGNIGVPHPCYVPGLAEVGVIFFSVGIPFILGIHTGIMHEKNI